MTDEDSNRAHALALDALSWTLQDEGRAERLLALTGLDPQALRTRIGDPALLKGVIAFLEGHEPDLVSCAQALDISPLELLALPGRL